ncbi:MarR family winged helix-turn-helix transcriptional regulator [Edaphobacter albus]|uniref:MarR family winged helix-turn-helix transcriptional regulator n=1 Tax=Edaphobacter sp. 4G125 TaxID=2763071 RepID=UPI0016457DF2|nr:MarR family transcriptional regulator [Edaphobacter sp. 4G125]QNI36894.1 MarR family transcriptional regulator [Edaphobacter sp. 4G125]
MARSGIPGGASAGFLVAQVGAHAAMRFAEALKPHRFRPQDAGILRLLSFSPGISQQDLARRLGMYASRLVGVLDELEERGLIERRPSESDRRLYALYLTKEGEVALETIGRVAREHQRSLFESLSAEEQETLASLLARVAERQGLTSGVHPGFGKIGTDKSKAEV